MTSIDAKIKAQILVEALPYIQQYAGEIVVIKYGGNAMINEELKDSVMMDIVLLSLIGVRVVLVHGGGPEITDMLKKIGTKARGDIERLLGSPIYLELWVKVKKDWRDSDFLMKNFGYREDE